MIPTYTEFHQGKLVADFTGVVYTDTGRFNYAAVRNGKVLVTKLNKKRWFKSEGAAVAALQETAPAAPSPTWKQRALASTVGSQFGAIVACALGEKVSAPCFSGRPSITSDGFVMCNFTDRHGNGHLGAFIGSLSDVVRNTRGLADHLNLKDEARAEYVAAIGCWLGRKLEV